MFNFWWLAGLVDGLEPRLPPLSSQKNKMLVFRLRSTSDDWLGWLMVSNPVCHPSPVIKIKCSFLDYVQLLMIGRAGRWIQWTQNLSASPLQPKKWNAHFWITFNFWWSARLVNGLKTHLPPVSSQTNKVLVFGLRSTSDDWPHWSLDSNPISNPVCHPSPGIKIKCSFLDYVQLLMIGRPVDWVNACFWITFKSAKLVDGLHLPPLSSKKKLLMIGNAWTLFGLHTFNFWWSAGRDQWTRNLSATPLQSNK